jgi:hypothetical protein
VIVNRVGIDNGANWNIQSFDQQRAVFTQANYPASMIGMTVIETNRLGSRV